MVLWIISGARSSRTVVAEVPVGTVPCGMGITDPDKALELFGVQCQTCGFRGPHFLSADAIG